MLRQGVHTIADMTTGDITLFGATGFVGSLTAHALAKHSNERLRVTLAGRNPAKLDAVRDTLPGHAKAWKTLRVDATNVDEVNAMARDTGVVLTTVGPYTAHGMTLVRACAEHGTHYADLTGEVPFMRRSIDECHELANRSGARIVHASGFDSLPSDLAAALAIDAALATNSGRVTRVMGQFRQMRGGLSGGTIASMLGVFDQARNNAAVQELVNDPYALNPEGTKGATGNLLPDTFAARRADNGHWIAPFIMAPSNTRVVRRTLALRCDELGHVDYDEVRALGRSRLGFVTASGVSAGIAALNAACSSAALRPLVHSMVPPPGEGPSESAREDGHFRLVTQAVTEGGVRVEARITGRRDPGYALTSEMLAQVGLSLACDSLPGDGGVLTPVTALTTAFAQRLTGKDWTIDVGPPRYRRS